MLPRRRKILEKLPYMYIQIMHESKGAKRHKKDVYYKVPELDRVIFLQKDPSLIFQLKSIIESQKNQCLPLRDIEKEVGAKQKWNLMNAISKYPTIFRVGGGPRVLPWVSLTPRAQQIAALEVIAREQMEPILVRNLRKLLMLSVDCMVPLETIELIENELGLPRDFEEVLIPKYPHFFSVKRVDNRAHLCLGDWDSSLAVTAREERLAREGCLEPRGYVRKGTISKDGNIPSPFAFRLNFPAGFRPNVSYLKQVQWWQTLKFPSPYLNARRFDIADPKAEKRVLAVLHELLSLTMHKMLTSAQVEAFHSEYQLPDRLLFSLNKHHGMFYITCKGKMCTVFLKEAYDGSNLIDKCPLLAFREQFIALSGRGDTSLCTGNHSSLL